MVDLVPDQRLIGERLVEDYESLAQVQAAILVNGVAGWRVYKSVVTAHQTVRVAYER